MLKVKKLYTKASQKIITSLLIFISGIIVGVIIYNTIKITTNKSYRQDKEIASLQRQIEDLREYRRPTNNIGAVISQPPHGQEIKRFTSVYKYSDFGIYSAQLENITSETIEYKYQDKIVVERYLYIKNNKSNYMLQTWEFRGKANTNCNNEECVIFSGYENNSLWPTFISNIKTDWEEGYKNKNKIQWYWSYQYTPNTLGVIALQTLITNKNTNNVVFVELSSGSGVMDKTDPKIEIAKEQLKKIADTFSLTN